MAPRKKNYLNNRDLLKEIHRSKNSFCSYLNEEDSQYDVILPSVEKINRNSISEARKNRADRIAKQNYENAIAAGEKVKQDMFTIDHLTIDKTDVVFVLLAGIIYPKSLGVKRIQKIFKTIM